MMDREQTFLFGVHRDSVKDKGWMTTSSTSSSSSSGSKSSAARSFTFICTSPLAFALCRFRPSSVASPLQRRRYLVSRPTEVRESPSNLGGCSVAVPREVPFASAKTMATHFDISPKTVKDVLIRELGLRQFTRRWVLHLGSAARNTFAHCASQITVGLAESAPRSGFQHSRNRGRVLVSLCASGSHHVCKKRELGQSFRPKPDRSFKSYDHYLDRGDAAPGL
jgi:hypothetical protein